MCHPKQGMQPGVPKSMVMPRPAPQEGSAGGWKGSERDLPMGAWPEEACNSQPPEASQPCRPGSRQEVVETRVSEEAGTWRDMA